MTEKEKMLKGMLYDTNNDADLIAERQECKELCRDYNDLRPKDIEGRTALLKKIIGSIKGSVLIEQPFYCDYGYNISLGENFYANFNMVILDEARVEFGDNVFVAPNCGFYTAGHPLDATERNKGVEYARPIKVGNNVWIGANTCVLPGVTIGDNCVIGAGSMVNRDIPAGSVAAGNPCRVIKSINPTNNNTDTTAMNKFLTLAAAALIGQTMSSQTLEKMNWFNEPSGWEIKGNSLIMDVTPKSDYWRISHYGFTVDDAPFYYAEYGGEFEAKVKIQGDYKVRFDQAGMMIRIDHENYIKTGIEFVDGKYNLSTVVTHKTSDWSVIALDRPVEAIWIKAVRRLDAVEIFYSFDDKEYHMMRNAWVEANHPVKVGMFAACPDGNGFKATFSDFTVKHLPDAVRTKWLKDNAE